MRPLPPPLGALLLFALFTTTHAIPAGSLFERRDTCAASGLSSCPSDLPKSFCCKTSDKCIALAGGTTAICCGDDDSGCKRIRPITCNMSFQDPDKNPGSVVKTTALGASMKKCGGEERCCPFGFTCNDDGECVMDQDQSEAPPGASPSKPTKPTKPTTTTAPAPAKSDVPSEGSSREEEEDDDDAEGEKKDSTFPTTAVVLGVLGGVLGLVAVALFVLFGFRKKNADNNERQPPRAKPSPRHSLASSTSFGRVISDPIPDANAVRSDFIRKPETTHIMGSNHALTRNISNCSGRLSRNFDPDISPLSSPPGSQGSRRSSAHVAPIRGMRTSRGDPQARGNRYEPNDEDMSVYDPPGMVVVHDYDRQTSFSEMANDAGLGRVHKGGAFVPGNTPNMI